MKKLISVLLLLNSISLSFSQEIDGEAISDTVVTSSFDEVNDAGVQYKYEMSFGILAHSNGFGVNFRRGKHLTGYKKRIWEIEVVNMKHPKEYKTYNPQRENAKGYIYGKMNSVFLIRPSIGARRVITRKFGKGGVELRFLYLGGASLALLKPVYLEIEYKQNNDRKYVTEKYDPDKHFNHNIYGKASFVNGLDEPKLIPGVFAKMGLSFEYGNAETKIRAIETGVSLDLYYKRVPIMADLDPSDDFDPNNMYFLSFYLNLYYGKKW